MKAIFSIIFIVFLLLKESIIFLIISIFFSKKSSIKSYDKKLQKLGEKICFVLPKLGPAFVKLGQFISTRHDLVGTIICDELKNLQDKAPTVSFKKVESILIKELGSLYNEIKIDHIPIAAASIAQVHKGQITINGMHLDIAIKVLRPNIRKKFAENIEMMQAVVNVINQFIGHAHRLRLSEVINVIAETAKAELDMQIEAAAADKLRHNCANHDGIYIPKIFWEYTTKSILAVEWIEGKRIENVDSNLKKSIVKKLAFSFFHQAYVDGFFHADIHPGNILIDSKNRIVLLDFGMFSYLPEKDRLFLVEIIYAFVQKDYEKVSEMHFKAGYITSNHDDKQKLQNMFALACRSVIEPIFGKSTSEISISKLLRRLFEITSEFNMHTQPQLILLQKNMMSLEGVLMSLDSDVNMWLLIEPWFSEWGKKNLNFYAVMKRKYSSAIETLEFLDEKIRKF